MISAIRPEPACLLISILKGVHKDIERAITSRLTYKIFVMDAVRALKCYTQDTNAGCGERGSTSRVNNIRKVLQ